MLERLLLLRQYSGPDRGRAPRKRIPYRGIDTPVARSAPTVEGRRWRRARASRLVVPIAGAALSVLVASPAWATGASVGAAEITVPGQLAPLRSGTSSTLYGVALPPGASCPGDTAHKGYHVFSYLVPETVSPQSVRFTNVPDRGLGYFTDGVYVGALNTAEFTGQIVGLPTEFSMSRLTATMLIRPGETRATWDGGIACADAKGVVASYWNTELVFTASANDPHGFVWSVAKTVLVPGPSHTGLWIAVGLLVAAGAFALLAVWFRNRPSRGVRHAQR